MAHDQTFNDLLRAFFPEFMELFFPRVARRLDFREVTFLDKEVFTDVPEGLLVNLVETYLELSDTEEREFEELVGREELAEVREMLTVYEERGYRRGREEGREEGVVGGKQDWLLRTLRLKFGALPAAVEARVAALTSEAELDACLERVLRAVSPEETGLSQL